MKRQFDKDMHEVDGPSSSKLPAPKWGGNARFEDNRSALTVQRKLQEGMNSSSQNGAPIQPKANNTGLPGNLKSGIENLSGFAMDDVKVHYNSSKPAQLQAHAYAQGTDIHLAPGQEKHLPHEAWHVVQQKQGRVQPTRQLKSKVNINDDAGLEREADVMGAKAAVGRGKQSTGPINTSTESTSSSIVQRQGDEKKEKRIAKAREFLETNFTVYQPEDAETTHAAVFSHGDYKTWFRMAPKMIRKKGFELNYFGPHEFELGTNFTALFGVRNPEDPPAVQVDNPDDFKKFDPGVLFNLLWYNYTLKGLNPANSAKEAQALNNPGAFQNIANEYGVAVLILSPGATTTTYELVTNLRLLGYNGMSAVHCRVNEATPDDEKVHYAAAGVD